MNLSQAYLEWKEATRLEGRLEERREMIESLLIAKFGELDRSLERVIDALLQLST